MPKKVRPAGDDWRLKVRTLKVKEQLWLPVMCVLNLLESLRKSHLAAEAKVSPLADNLMHSLQLFQSIICVGLLHWGMNSTRMTLSALLNADAITFPADLYTFILVLGEVRHLHCWPAYLHWGGNWCTHVSLPVTVEFQELISFFTQLTVGQSNLTMSILCFPSGILAPSLHTLCGIPVLHNHNLLLSQNSSSTRAAFRFAHDVLGWPVSSSWMLIQPLFNPLHHFLICCTLIMLSPYTSVSWQWISLQETCFTHKIKTHYWLFRGDRFPLLFPLYINLSNEQHLTGWLLHQYCMLPILQVLMVVWQKHYGLENVTYWPCLACQVYWGPTLKVFSKILLQYILVKNSPYFTWKPYWTYHIS